MLGQQYHTGTGTECGHAALDGFAQGFHESRIVEQLAQRGALATGDDESVEWLVYVFQLPDFKRLGPDSLQHLFVLYKRALKG